MNLNDKVTALVNDGMNKCSTSALEAAIIMLVKRELEPLEAQLAIDTINPNRRRTIVRLAARVEELEAENSTLKQQVKYYQHPPYFPEEEEEGDW